MKLGELLRSVLTPSIFGAAFRISTPIMYAALCAAVTQQVGILNIGTEGIMLMGAFVAVATGYFTGSWILAIFAAMLSGMIIATVLAVGNIKYNASMPAIGIGMNMFALYFTRFMLESVFKVSGSFISEKIPSIPLVKLGFLKSGSVLDQMFNNLCVTDWFVILLILGLAFMFYKTPLGLRMRSVGRFPLAAQTAGINVRSIQYKTIIFAGALGGLAGAHLSIGYSTMFVQNMTNGRGFMGIAAMWFGNANPFGSAIGSFIFGFFEALGSRLQPYGVSSQAMLMLPYIVVLVILSIVMAVKKIYSNRRKSPLYNVKQH